MGKLTGNLSHTQSRRVFDAWANSSKENDSPPERPDYTPEERAQILEGRKREEQEMEEKIKRLRPFLEEAERWRVQGLCYYCGGTFKFLRYNREGTRRSGSILDYRKCKSCLNLQLHDASEISYNYRYAPPDLVRSIERDLDGTSDF